MLPLSGDLLRTCFTLKTFKKFQQISLLPLLLLSLPRDSPQLPRPFFLLPTPSLGLKRPVTKARRLKWSRAKRLARGELNLRIKVRRLQPCQKSRVKRLPIRSNVLIPRPRITQLRPRMTFILLRHSFRILAHLLLFFVFVVIVYH